MNKASAILLALLVFAAMAVGREALAGSCYAMEDKEAEQLLRLHSELMVITVTCRQGSTGRDLIKAYTGFTRRHAGIIREAEQTLISHYSTTYGGDGTSRLDKLRTKLANEFGQRVADESAPLFCGRLRDKVTYLYDATAPSVFQASLAEHEDAETNEPLCGKGGKTARKDTFAAVAKTASSDSQKKAPTAQKTKNTKGD